MRKSTTQLLRSFGVPPLWLLALPALMVGSTPAGAQKETPPQLAMHTATYAAYGTPETAAEKPAPTGVTIPLKVTPNPTTGSFRARMYGSKEEHVRVEILDQWGRVIDARQVSAQAELRFGYWYRPGTYFLHIIQGTNRKKVKLVKLED